MLVNFRFHCKTRDNWPIKLRKWRDVKFYSMFSLFPLRWVLLKTVFRKRKRKSLYCVFTLHKMALSCRSRAMTAKKCAKRELPNIVLKKKWIFTSNERELHGSNLYEFLLSFTVFATTTLQGNKTTTTTTTTNNSFLMVCLLFLARTLAKFSSSVLVVGASPFSPNAQSWISFAYPALDSDLAWLLFQRS